MKKYTRILHGFSLLEITFVILLISITLVSTGLYIHNANEKAAAKKVALQLNYWLNAAVDYYAVNTAWPSNLEALANSAGEKISFNNYGYQFISNSSGKGASIQIELPSEAFAMMVKAHLSRAIVEPDGNKAILYAYTPPVATRIPSEVQNLGVGYLHFYNCKYTDYHKHSDNKICAIPSPESPCVDPANSMAYKFDSSYYYLTNSQFSKNYDAGVCVMSVPKCPESTVPQIYYAISQFRAPFDPQRNVVHSKIGDHQYQTYPYQIDVMCQMHSQNGKNLGPCGPNTINTLNNPVEPLKYWAISVAIRNSHVAAGVTQGIKEYGRSQSSDNWTGIKKENYDPTNSFYDQHFDKWSAMVSYIVGCVPVAQINDKVSGGVVRYMGSDNSKCYSQEMMVANASSNACDNNG